MSPVRSFTFPVAFPAAVRRVLVPLMLALLMLPGTLVLQGCGAGDTEAGENPDTAEEIEKKEEAVPVEVATLETGSIESVLRSSTNLEAEETVGVYAQAAERVADLLVEEGDTVQRGQVLVRLQADAQRTELAKAQGQLARAQREFNRQERLWTEKLISEQAYNDAAHELEQVRLAVDEAQLQLSYTVVRAPITGTVTRRAVNLGDQIGTSQLLFELVDFGTIVARIFVPEKELVHLSRGQTARIVAPALGGAEFTGRVERLSPIVDPQSGTVKVTVGIPGRPQNLRPGLYVDVSLVTDTRDQVVLVPKRALVYDQDQVFVYRIADAGEGGEGGQTVERLLVEPALEDKENVLPADGRLSVGDRIVIAGQAGLKDGATVRLLGQATTLVGEAETAP
jgi:membrane fusion protein (multidrug efflux system)